MGLRLFADGKRAFTLHWCRLTPVCVASGVGGGRFAIVVLFTPRLSCCGVGRAGSVRMVCCASVDCR